MEKQTKTFGRSELAQSDLSEHRKGAVTHASHVHARRSAADFLGAWRAVNKSHLSDFKKILFFIKSHLSPR